MYAFFARFSLLDIAYDIPYRLRYSISIRYSLSPTIFHIAYDIPYRLRYRTLPIITPSNIITS